MQNFEKFWQDNMHHYKELARVDFERVSAGPWSGVVDIDTDDDFSLDVGNRIEVYGASVDAVVNKLIEKMQEATYLRINPSKKEAWPYIRDEAISQLRQGETWVSFGGNHTIEVLIAETAPKFKTD